jgi:hypothetical protein
LLLFNQTRLKQQGAEFACGTYPGDASGLAKHRRFVGGTQMGKNPAADIHAFTDIQRHRVAFAMKK